MKIYTRVAIRTGEILDKITIPERDFDLHNIKLYEGEFDSQTQYCLNDEFVNRPIQDTTVDKLVIVISDQEIATFSNIPNPCMMHVYNKDIGHDTVLVEDNSVTFTAKLPGDYTIIFEAFPYLPWEIKINAV